MSSRSLVEGSSSVDYCIGTQPSSNAIANALVQFAVWWAIRDRPAIYDGTDG